MPTTEAPRKADVTSHTSELASGVNAPRRYVCSALPTRNTTHQAGG